jgi:uncharacterized protein YegL
MSYTDDIEIPRRTMVLFFVVDVSGSMDGSKINSLNEAIKETIPAIKEEVAEKNSDAQIKIAVLEFSSGMRWSTPNGPVAIEQFQWNDLKADGVTDFGEACKALNEKLSTKGFMQEASGSFPPAIFLLSDGDPTDNWQSALAALKQNNWFKVGVKVAIAIGDEANKDVLKEFTGSMEAVLETHNATMLKKMIKFVSVHASKVASKSSNAGDADDEGKQRELLENLGELKDEIATEPANVDPDNRVW